MVGEGREGSLRGFRRGTSTAIFHMEGKEEESRMRLRRGAKYEMELGWRLCSIMGGIWSKPGAAVLEYWEIVEIT